MIDYSLDITRLGPGRVISLPFLEVFGLTAKISTRDFKTVDGFLTAIGIDPNNSVGAEQVHGTCIATVDIRDLGAGITRPPINACDALITNTPDVPLVIRTADCLPIFILDTSKKAIGLIHAGWKGTVGNITGRTLMAMADRFDISPSNCIIAIGPCISKDCYEVDVKVAGNIVNSDYHGDCLDRVDEKHWHLDLAKMNIEQLIMSGVKEDHIHVSGKCTHCETDTFYSYRKEGMAAGRIVSVFMIRG